jgi:hypothetical protein
MKLDIIYENEDGFAIGRSPWGTLYFSEKPDEYGIRKFVKADQKEALSLIGSLNGSKRPTHLLQEEPK